MAQVSMEVLGDERGTLLSFVESQRTALRESLLGLTEEQAASRPSASELSLSGLVKHAAEVELNWLRMAQQKPNERYQGERNWEDGFRLIEGESIPSVLAFWEDVARQTADFITGVPSLDQVFPLPCGALVPEGRQGLDALDAPAPGGGVRPARGPRGHRPRIHRRHQGHGLDAG